MPSRLALVLLAALAAGCGDDITAPADAQGTDAPLAVVSTDGDDLVIERGYARPVIAGGNSAAYLTLRADAADVLATAASDAFDVVELHRTTSEGGVMRMAPVERIDLPAGETVELAPGGYHLMLMNARRDLDEGETLPIYLGFGSGRSVEVSLPVERR